MKQLSMKDLIILAYRGVEAAEKENNELKATLGAMYTNVLAEEKQQELVNVNPSESSVNADGATNSTSAEEPVENTEVKNTKDTQKKTK